MIGIPPSKGSIFNVYDLIPLRLRPYYCCHRELGKLYSEDNKDKILDARRKVNNGTADIVQGRYGSIIVMYVIPKKVPVEPQKIFSLKQLRSVYPE